MINAIWVCLMCGGILYAAWHGQMEHIGLCAVTAAEQAVVLSFKLTGVMCLWLGIMNIAEKAGLIRLFARLIGPLLSALFPGLPSRHPARGAIAMTVSANLLGMGNAVTPLGIKAMTELQKLNRRKDTASADMCTLLALCTTGFTFIPATVIALRAASGSHDPAVIVGPTVLVSLAATLVVVVVDKICRTLFPDTGR